MEIPSSKKKISRHSSAESSGHVTAAPQESQRASSGVPVFDFADCFFGRKCEVKQRCCNLGQSACGRAEFAVGSASSSTNLESMVLG